jgi:DNA-binding MarR family transcriptional regulator
MVAWCKHMTETRNAAIEALSADLARTVRFVRTLKQRYGVSDPASLPLLFRLLEGPVRPTELADHLHLDLSVVSRQLTSLSERGLVAKTKDPLDRRAHQVELTEAGRVLTAQVERIRTDFLASLVREWDETDINHFATYLHRLSESLDQYECTGR